MVFPGFFKYEFKNRNKVSKLKYYIEYGFKKSELVLNN